jgi:hypothetical protein
METTMHSLDPVPAVRRIETDRPDCSAFEIAGHVSAADAENLYGLLEAAYALHDRIDLLIRLADHDGVDWAEISGETLSQGKTLARQHVRRCAAVGEPDWTASVGGWFEPAEPVELGHFAADREAAAWEWLGAHPVEQS